MGIPVYKFTVEQSTKVAVARKCSNCGREWTAYLSVSAEGAAESMRQGDVEAINKAKENALKNLGAHVMVKQHDVDEQVLCPDCGHFATLSVEKHFSKGYKTGLLSKFRQAKWGCLLGVLSFLLLALISSAGIVGIMLYVIESGDWLWCGWIILLGFLIVISAVNFLRKLRMFVQSAKIQQGVKNKMNSSTEDELLQLVVKCYKENEDSLELGDAWINVLSREVCNQAGSSHGC